MPLYWTERRRRRALPKPIPQFELPQSEAVFNLAAETTTDGDRLAREQAARQQAQQQQDQQQPSLL